MRSIKDEIRIQAGSSAVYQALTSEGGYRAWWNTAAEVPGNVGGVAKLRFLKDGKPVHMQFRIDALTPNELVRWTCVGNDAPDWIGTTLSWRIRQDGGDVVVSLEHGGWQEAPAEMVAQSWKHFLGSLKSYVETGTGQPW